MLTTGSEKGENSSNEKEVNVPEVSLLGSAALHGLVVGVQVRVVVNLQSGRVESGGYLDARVNYLCYGDGERGGKRRTLARMASSTGVVDALMVESCRPTLEKPKAYLRNMLVVAGEG